MATIIGIDPGLTGAYAFNSDGECRVEDIPVERFGIVSSVKNQVSGAVLAENLRLGIGDLEVTAVLEHQGSRPGMACGAVFSIGQSYGTILGVLGALKVPVRVVKPNVWKSAMNLKKDKELSRTMAIQLFPHLASQLGHKKDHNRAEAILLAEYGRRHLR